MLQSALLLLHTRGLICMSKSSAMLSTMRLTSELSSRLTVRKSTYSFTVEQSNSLALRQAKRFVASKVSVATRKLQQFPQTCSALQAGCLLPNLGLYGRLAGIGRLMQIALQHGGTIAFKRNPRVRSRVCQ